MARLMMLFIATLLLLLWMGWTVAIEVDMAVWAAALAVYFWLRPPDDHDKPDNGEQKAPTRLKKAA